MSTVQRELVQVVKTVDNVDYYGWKLKTVGDPVQEGDEVWLELGQIPSSLYEAHMVNKSFTGTKFGTKYGRWGICYVCQCEFPRNQMTNKNCRWYCKEDYKDDFK